MGMDFQYLNVNNFEIRYLDTRTTGNPVLLVHGLGGSIESWINNISKISTEQLRVIVLDLPGFGFSSKPRINYSVSFYTTFIATFLNSLKVRSSSLSIVGCSLGGHIAAEVALNHPNLVSKLVLISPAGALPVSFKGTPALRSYVNVLKAKTLQEVRKALSSIDDDHIDNTYAQEFYRKLLMPGAKEAFMSALNGSAHAPRLSRRLHMIKAETLLIWGKNDRIIPVRFIEPFVKMENCRIILLEKCGHVPFISRPALFNKIVTDFIKEQKKI
jgi:pimeloyl-ACP methyl ester carboxylesterase